jgi:hypothetical protein
MRSEPLSRKDRQGRARSREKANSVHLTASVHAKLALFESRELFEEVLHAPPPVGNLPLGFAGFERAFAAMRSKFQRLN